MTPRETVLEALRHRPTDVIPYELSIHEEIRKKLDAYYGGAESFPAHESFLAARGVEWRCEDLPNGHFRDIFGVEWTQGNIFHIVKPVLEQPSLEGYRFPRLVRDEQVPELAAWCAEHAGKFTTFNFGLTFWERAWALRGMENILMDLAAEPRFAHQLFERLMELHLEAMDKMLHLPFDSIRFGDDFGGQRGTLMGLPHWRTYIKPRLAKMYARVRDAGKTVSIHSCGDNSEILGDLIDMGLEIFNPAQPEANDLAALKKEYGQHLTFEGGIGTQRTLPFGTPEEVRDEVRRCRQVLGEGGGYIMTTTKPIRPEVPVENAVACVEAILEEAGKGTPR
ncbi:MAG: uroporphyrinogen decarboxylase family protein [Candidatus Brocadiia bacterium]